jgi:hypothetical protein
LTVVLVTSRRHDSVVLSYPHSAFQSDALLAFGGRQRSQHIRRHLGSQQTRFIFCREEAPALGLWNAIFPYHLKILKERNRPAIRLGLRLFGLNDEQIELA